MRFARGKYVRGKNKQRESSYELIELFHLPLHYLRRLSVAIHHIGKI